MVMVRVRLCYVYGCTEGSEVHRQRGPEMALYTKATERNSASCNSAK